MLLIGDSLLRGVTSRMLSSESNEFENEVLSISGCNIARLIDLFQKREFKNHKKFYVMVGTNTLARKNSHLTMKEMQELVKLVNQKYPSVFLTLIKVPFRTKKSVLFRPNGDNGGRNIKKRVKFFNTKLEKLKTNVSNKLIFDLLDLEISKAHLLPDGLHLTFEGMKQIVKIICEHCNKNQ